MKLIISSSFEQYRKKILQQIHHFKKGGAVIDAPARNSIKTFDIDNFKVAIKSFKIPNAVNKIAYRYFRKSKAERSFYYARHLTNIGIGTPKPIAYAEQTSAFAFSKSYYVSELLPYDLTYRELVQQPNYKNHEAILRAFTRFTFQLHENNIEFLDHSPGNTLIQLNHGEYKFFLVDLNRMNFKKMSIIDRTKNFSRLTPKKEMVAIMADEYAKLIEQPKEEVFEKMWYFTQVFQKKFHKKKQLKKKLKFWKNK